MSVHPLLMCMRCAFRLFDFWHEPDLTTGAVLLQGQVRMAHVDQAVREMYGAVHMQLLGSCCQLDKLLLACLIMETNAQGAAAQLHYAALDAAANG